MLLGLGAVGTFVALGPVLWMAASALHPLSTSDDCDVVVPLGQKTVDGREQGIHPGDRVCLAPGKRGALRLQNLSGTAADPITVVNGGDVVEITGGGKPAIELRHSTHLRVTGAGAVEQCGAELTEAEQACGIRLFGAHNGLSAAVGTEHLTVDHVEVGRTRSAGIRLHDKNADRVWTQHDVVVRHSYVHDVGTEGFYVGASDYADGDRHLLDGVEISQNLVVRTGWDGIQVGSAPWRCTISHNFIDEAGLDGESRHAFGIIVNRGSSCDVLANRISKSARDGIYDQGLHGQTIAGNVIVDAGVEETGAGINVRAGDQAPDNPETPDYPRSTRILDNRIEGTSGDGIRLRNAAGRSNRIERNELCDVDDDEIDLGPGVSALVQDNTEDCGQPSQGR